MGDNLYCPVLAVCRHWSLAGSWQSSQPDGMVKRASPSTWRRKTQCRRSGEFLPQTETPRLSVSRVRDPIRNLFCWTKEAKDSLNRGEAEESPRIGRASLPMGPCSLMAHRSIQQGCLYYSNPQNMVRNSSEHGSQKVGGAVPVKPSPGK